MNNKTHHHHLLLLLFIVPLLALQFGHRQVMANPLIARAAPTASRGINMLMNNAGALRRGVTTFAEFARGPVEGMAAKMKPPTPSDPKMVTTISRANGGGQRVQKMSKDEILLGEAVSNGKTVDEWHINPFEQFPPSYEEFNIKMPKLMYDESAQRKMLKNPVFGNHQMSFSSSMANQQWKKVGTDEEQQNKDDYNRRLLSAVDLLLREKGQQRVTMEVLAEANEKLKGSPAADQ